MKLVKIARNETGAHMIYGCNDRSLGLLVDFLLHSVDTDWSYEMFTQWLKGKEHQDCTRVSGEVYGLVERDGRVYVYDEFAPEEELYSYFNTTKKICLILLMIGYGQCIESRDLTLLLLLKKMKK